MSVADAAGCRDARPLTTRWSQSAKAGFALPMIAVSPARSIGIVVTAIAPAFITASQVVELRPVVARRSTRLPGTTPALSTFAMRFARASSSR